MEKLQTVSTKYRRYLEEQAFPQNFMRHYYDLYCLLQVPAVQGFIGTAEYQAHKQKRFRSGDNPVIAENEAFLLTDSQTRQAYERAYLSTHALYYREQPPFTEILAEIRRWAERL